MMGGGAPMGVSLTAVMLGVTLRNCTRARRDFLLHPTWVQERVQGSLIMGSGEGFGDQGFRRGFGRARLRWEHQNALRGGLGRGF